MSVAFSVLIVSKWLLFSEALFPFHHNPTVFQLTAEEFCGLYDGRKRDLTLRSSWLTSITTCPKSGDG